MIWTFHSTLRLFKAIARIPRLAKLYKLLGIMCSAEREMVNLAQILFLKLICHLFVAQYQNIAQNVPVSQGNVPVGCLKVVRGFVPWAIFKVAQFKIWMTFFISQTVLLKQSYEVVYVWLSAIVQIEQMKCACNWLWILHVNGTESH